MVFIKILIQSFFLFILLFSYVHAITENNIKEYTQNQLNFVITSLKNKSLKEENKKEIIFNELAKIIDFELIAKISLGNNYFNTLTKEQQNIFIETFSKNIKNSYFSKFNTYKDEIIEYKELQKVKENRIQYTISIISNKKEATEVIFKYYKNDANNEWLIYDIDILGVSFVQIYRTQFQEILKKNKDFDNLLTQVLRKD